MTSYIAFVLSVGASVCAMRLFPHLTWYHAPVQPEQATSGAGTAAPGTWHFPPDFFA
jgi:hypothetical protein